MNAVNTMIFTEAGTGFHPMALAAVRPGIAVPSRTLDQAIQRAADQMAGTLKPFPGDIRQPFTRALTVLTFLTRCYAEQIYDSVTVATRAEADPVFPWHWMETLPEAPAIRRFRTENSDAIHHCLTAALQFQTEEKISAGRLAKVSLPQLAKEAYRRIIMAAYLDSMEFEPDEL
jgi:hypothetical protein